MTPREFCYWLQGVFEIGKLDSLDEEQTKIVKDHLNLVFVHSIDGPDPTGALQAAHDGKKLLTEDDKKELEQKISGISHMIKPGSGLARC